MKQDMRLVLVPSLICAMAGLALAVVQRLTDERIRNVASERRMNAIREVLPPGGGAPKEVAFRDDRTGATNAVFYVTMEDGRFAGAATEAHSPNGYAGDIRLMVGFNAFAELQAVAVLEHRETPGLGARIAGDAFKGAFPGRSLLTTRWKLDRDGGDLDAITAATVSSRAVAEAVAGAVARYLLYKDRLAQPSDREAPFTHHDLRLDDLEDLLDESD